LVPAEVSNIVSSILSDRRNGKLAKRRQAERRINSMTFEIATLLAEDGIALGAMYALMALGFVLVFSVTRVIFVPFGDLVAFAGLTLASLQRLQTPGTVWLIATLSAVAFLMESWRLAQIHRIRAVPRAALTWICAPMAPVLITLAMREMPLPKVFEIALTIALIVPLGPLLYRIVFEPMANASVLTLLMVSVALHFTVSGLALLYFGPEGLRSKTYVTGSAVIAGLSLSYQLVMVLVVTGLLSLLMLVFFSMTFTGKALRATASHRDGARLVGIRPAKAGATAFLLASAIAGVVGILISPIATIYYDTGLIVGLKGFVGAVFAGLVSYPLAVVGSLLIGLVESYSSFYWSALKEAIVFAAVIPIVLWRWLYTGGLSNEEPEEDE
jgi:branched-chain amino acid transport system permease protein